MQSRIGCSMRGSGTLDDLEADPMQLSDRLDWVAKKWLLNAFRESENLS